MFKFSYINKFSKQVPYDKGKTEPTGLPISVKISSEYHTMYIHFNKKSKKLYKRLEKNIKVNVKWHI